MENERSESQETALQRDVNELNSLLNNLHILERVMVVESDDPIFDYPIGFDSEDEKDEMLPLEKMNSGNLD